MRLTLLFLSSIFLAGCATPDFNYQPKTVAVNYPSLGSISTAYVGEDMLKQGNYAEHDAIHLPITADVSSGYDLLPGYYKKVGEDENSETYMPGVKNYDSEAGSIDKSFLADQWLAVMAYKNTQTLCVITVFNAAVCEDDINFERVKQPIFTKNAFQQTLIYSGRIGNKVNMSYRAISGDIMKPEYGNDVEYDLTASKIIGYRGARIEILEATNELIRYRVIENFSRSKI